MAVNAIFIAANAHTPEYAFHAWLFAAGSVATVFAIVNRYYERGSALPVWCTDAVADDLAHGEQAGEHPGEQRHEGKQEAGADEQRQPTPALRNVEALHVSGRTVVEITLKIRMFKNTHATRGRK